MFLNEKISFGIIWLGDHMKIIKFSKLKDNRYNVVLENDEVLKLYDDVIIKYDLVRTKLIDDSLLDELVKYNDSLEAYYNAVKYITKKLRCELELKKLKQFYPKIPKSHYHHRAKTFWRIKMLLNILAK